MSSYKIKHSTTYTYSKDVFFEPFTLRLKPKSNNFQKLIKFKLSIAPKPDGKTNTIDIYDNNIHTVWFSGTHKKLLIDSESTIKPLNNDPFSYLITDDSFFTLPVTTVDKSFGPYLKRDRNTDILTDIVKPILNKSGNQTIQFLNNLNIFIYKNFEAVIRETGKPWRVRKTIKEQRGSCRDLTVLFIQCCRSLDLPARFTSGYNEIDIDTENRHLHAWAEVYLPGAGWRGFDPALGLAVADKHIALASSPDPDNTYPVIGNFRGTGASSSLSYKIKIEEYK